MIFRIILLWLLSATQTAADALVATRTLRAHAIILAEDIARSDSMLAGAITDVADVLGMETRVMIYAGRPIRKGDVGRPAIVDRNQIVPLVFVSGLLRIETEGRALGRGAVGDPLRIMNLASRSTVSGTVQPDGSVLVGH